MPRRRVCPTWWQKLKSHFSTTHLSISSSEHSKPSRYSKGWRMRNHWRRQSSNPNQRHCRRRKKKSQQSAKVAHFRPRRLLPLNLTLNITRRRPSHQTRKFVFALTSFRNGDENLVSRVTQGLIGWKRSSNFSPKPDLADDCRSCCCRFIPGRAL